MVPCGFLELVAPGLPAAIPVALVCGSDSHPTAAACYRFCSGPSGWSGFDFQEIMRSLFPTRSLILIASSWVIRCPSRHPGEIAFGCLIVVRLTFTALGRRSGFNGFSSHGIVGLMVQLHPSFHRSFWLEHCISSSSFLKAP